MHSWRPNSQVGVALELMLDVTLPVERGTPITTQDTQPKENIDEVR